ncbi:MAG: PAS domain S-box protein [Nitrospirae bacterium]|nr:PAS domain S-box protein [Nitrospirota bacterium]
MTKEQYISSRYVDYLHYWTSIGLGFGSILVLSLIPLDYLATPDNFFAFLAYRLCTSALLFLLYLLNRRMTTRKRMTLFVILAAVAVSTMLALMIARFGGHQSPYAPGFILVGIFVSGIIPLYFGICLISSLIVYSLYLVPILLYDPITNIPYFASESILIFSCISAMLIMRYVANKRLFYEFGLQFDFEQYRTSLEAQVKDRTYQLTTTIMHLEQEVQDRENAERALIESQEIFRHITDDSPMAISMVTREGTIEYINVKHLEIMGYTHEDIPTLERWWSLAYPDAAARENISRKWQDLVDRLFSGERVPNVVRQIVCKDGSIKDLELRIARAADKIIVAFDDITERRRVDDLIRQAKDDWEDTFDTINDAITIHDKDLNIIRTNKAAERLLGKSGAEIVGTKCFRSYHGADLPPDACPGSLTLQNGASSVIELFEPHLNKYLEVKALPRCDRSGALIGVIHVVRDITERKKAEEALSEQQDFASNLIENSTVATFVLDSSHIIMIWNKACEELTGCYAAEMIGTDHQWKPFYAEQRPTVADVIIDNRAGDLAELYQNYSRSKLNPLAIKAEGWYRNLGGKDRYISFEASPIFNSSGRLIAAIETLQDITEEKRLEEQLFQAQKIEAIGQLAGGVAHDFNNILTAIVGYAHLTLMKMPKDEPLRINVEQILQASDKATVLTQSLLAFSRKQIISPKPVNLNEIVKRLEKLLIRLIREDIHIATICAPEDLTVFADAGQIEQVLMNLVTNARDAMPGGGRIEIRTEAVLMDSTFIDAHGYGKTGSYALLSVSDNGEGMDAKTREKIFEPFFTTKEQGKGTGLGLAMVYGIIKQHEGFINVDSEPGKGTVFMIHLPLSAGSAEMPDTGGEAVTSTGGTETVLLAEDDSSLRKLMTTILRNQGYIVIEAKDGADAVEKYGVSNEAIQLLILDGIMPKKNGKEALDEIRLINPSVKALFVSGYAEDIVSRQGLLEPGITFIQKPLSPSVLLKKVRELLDA